MVCTLCILFISNYDCRAKKSGFWSVGFITCPILPSAFVLILCLKLRSPNMGPLQCGSLIIVLCLVWHFSHVTPVSFFSWFCPAPSVSSSSGAGGWSHNCSQPNQQPIQCCSSSDNRGADSQPEREHQRSSPGLIPTAKHTPQEACHGWVSRLGSVQRHLWFSASLV